MLAHPFSGPLLLGCVENLVHEMLTAWGVDDAEDIAGDFDQVTFQFALVPLLKDVIQIVVGQSQRVLQKQIGLANKLHITVFDSVVNHFDVMPRPARSDPFAARNVARQPDFGTDCLEEFLNVWPSLR